MLYVGVDRTAGPSPLVEERIRVEITLLARLDVTGSRARGVGVVDPSDVLLRQLLEDRLLRETTIVEGGIVGTVSVTSTGGDLRTLNKFSNFARTTARYMTYCINLHKHG